MVHRRRTGLSLVKPKDASNSTCAVHRTYNGFGDRSFGVAGPRVWNALPPFLQQDISNGQFKRQL